MFQSLRTHLLLLGMLSALPALLLLYLLSNQIRDDVSQKAEADALRVVRQLSAQQETLIESTRQILATAIEVPEAHSTDSQKCTKFFKKLDAALEERTNWKNFGGFVRMDNKGKIDCASSKAPLEADLSDRAYFKEVMATGSFAMSDMIIGRGEKIPIFVLAQPIKNDKNQITHVLILVVRTTWLNAALASHSLVEGSSVTLLDSQGEIFGTFPPKDDLVGTKVTVQPIIEAMTAKASGVLKKVKGIDGKISLTAFHKLPGTTVRLVLNVPLNKINETANKVYIESLFGLSLLVGFSFAIAWWGVNRLVLRKVTRLTETANKISSGEINSRSGLESDTTELGILGRAFDGMADELNKRVAERTQELSDEIRVRQEAEDQLRKLSQAVEQSPNMVFITDINGTIEYVNSKFTETSGYTPEEALGSNPKILQDEDTPQEIYNDLWNTILSGKGWRGEIKDRRKNGNVFWASVSISPIRDRDNQITHFVSMHEDITERKRNEHNIQIALKKVEIANQAKSEFLSAMSHELRTPMNAILGFGQMLNYNATEPLTKSQKMSVEHILRSGDHLLDLINDVLDLAKIESGKMVFAIEDIRVSHIIDECLSMINDMAASQNIHIKVIPNEERGQTLRADDRRLKQVLINLISNAIKYNRPEGSIIISYYESDEGMGRISIADTGYGIPQKRQSELFTAFSRLGAENSEIEGSGIGLVICKDLVELMGGNVGFESEEGKGSTFWIELPLISPLKEKKKSKKPNQSVSSAKPLENLYGTMLYVEDNPSNLQLMEMIVQNINGLTMLSATTAEEGIDVARSKKPDVIILDINLPGMSGLEAVKVLQKMEETKHIPILALSAAATDRDIKQATQAGFLRYLTKPLHIPEIIEALKAALNGEN